MSTGIINEMGPKVLQIRDVMQHPFTSVKQNCPRRAWCGWSRDSVVRIATRCGLPTVVRRV